MADEELPAEVEVLLHRLGELRVDHAGGDLFVICGEQRLEDFVERVCFHAALAKHVRLASGHIEFHARHARAILPAVVLLFHQEKKLCEAPERRTVFFLVVSQRFFQADQGDAAFVGDFIGHGKRAKLPSPASSPDHRRSLEPAPARWCGRDSVG
jgi:hypothetical protein